MIRARNVYVVLALGSLAALPACSKVQSMMGRSSGGSTSASAVQPVANDMVRQVQARLQRDGYYKMGNVDGVWGVGTMNAVQAFQRDHNLGATGKLDVPTLQALNITDTGNNPSMTTNDPAVAPGSTSPTVANPTYTGPNTTTTPGYTGPTTTPGYPGPTGTTTTRQP